MDVSGFLTNISEFPHVSGHEGCLAAFLAGEFSKYAETSLDKFGNLIARKSGAGPRVMLCAHMDEIGLMVSAVREGGFIKFTAIGGMDPRNLSAQEVTIHGREKVYGVIGNKPPHLIKPEDRGKTAVIHDMAIDTGFSEEKLNALVKPGDIITFNQGVTQLSNNRLAGRALDDAAGLACLYLAMKNLAHFNHSADLYFVATAQEEVGLRGAATAAYTVKPDIGIAIDAGHGRANDIGEHESIELGKGPGIATGPNFNRKLFEALKQTAIKNNIKYQVDVRPGIVGADAAAIQISGGGVSTGLIAVPLRYMHSTVEMLDKRDIENCGRLISEYIISLNSQDREGGPCY